MRTPLDCPKCGGPLSGPGPAGGRPARFCSEGCKASAEAEMRRLNVLLRKFEERRAAATLSIGERIPDKRTRERMLGEAQARHDEVIGEMQARYDHLAGVPRRDEAGS